MQDAGRQSRTCEVRVDQAAPRRASDRKRHCLWKHDPRSTDRRPRAVAPSHQGARRSCLAASCVSQPAGACRHRSSRLSAPHARVGRSQACERASVRARQKKQYTSINDPHRAPLAACHSLPLPIILHRSRPHILDESPVTSVTSASSVTTPLSRRRTSSSQLLSKPPRDSVFAGRARTRRLPPLNLHLPKGPSL